MTEVNDTHADEDEDLYPTMELRFVSRTLTRPLEPNVTNVCESINVLQQWYTSVKGDDNAEGMWVDVELETEE